MSGSSADPASGDGLPPPLSRGTLVEVARRYGTPCTVLVPGVASAALQRLERTFDGVAEVRVALKAAASPYLLLEMLDRRRALSRAWIDVGSLEEHRCAMALGAPPQALHFYGPGARTEDVTRLLAVGSGVTADSLRQVDAARRATVPGASVLVRARSPTALAPDSAWVSSGGPNKLGMELDTCLDQVSVLGEGGHLTGVHCHLGSMVHSPRPYLELAESLVAAARGSTECLTLNLGGGLPYPYEREADAFDYAELCAGLGRLRRSDPWARFVIEPGRAVFAGAAVHVCTVLDVKHPRGGAPVTICDGRLASLDIPLRVINCSRADGLAHGDGQLVGTACTPHDVLTAAPSPPAKEGDVVAIADVGAYALQLEGSLHLRSKATEILAQPGGDFEVVRTRASDDAMLSVVL